MHKDVHQLGSRIKGTTQQRDRDHGGMLWPISATIVFFRFKWPIAMVIVAGPNSKSLKDVGGVIISSDLPLENIHVYYNCECNLVLCSV